MRSVRVTEYIGENVGPIDWSYDFEQHASGPHKGGIHPESIRQGKDTLRVVEQALAAGKRVTFAPSDFSAFEVRECCMYDGWPFWRPTPYIDYVGPLGSLEWAPFYNLRASRIRVTEDR